MITPSELHCRDGDPHGPHMSKMSRSPWPRTLWTWARGSGGLPVDLKAFSASTVVRLSMSPSLSKLTPEAPQGVAPVDTMVVLMSSTTAAPWPSDEPVRFSSSNPRLVLTRNTTRILPPEAESIGESVAAGTVIDEVVAALFPATDRISL